MDHSEPVPAADQIRRFSMQADSISPLGREVRRRKRGAHVLKNGA